MPISSGKQTSCVHMCMCILVGINVKANQDFIFQLKNMISALYSSREGKTKSFFGGVNFGWFAIQDMFSRKVERARAGVPRRVPELQESYVYWDIWTRLNVKPAKIMQVYAHVHALHVHNVMLYTCMFWSLYSSPMFWLNERSFCMASQLMEHQPN